MENNEELNVTETASEVKAEAPAVEAAEEKPSRGRRGRGDRKSVV